MLVPPLGDRGPEEEQQRGRGESRVGFRPGEVEDLISSARELPLWQGRRWRWGMSPSPRIGEVRLWEQGWAESGTTALVGGGLAPKGEDVRTTCHGEVGQQRAGPDFRSGGRVG